MTARSVFRRPSLFLVCALIAACSSSGAKESVAPAVDAVRDARMEILQLEASRSDGGGRLQAHARSGDAGLRRQAVVALGRMPLERHGAEVTQVLVEALTDEDSEVRGAAAFALGQRGDVSAAPAMAARLRDRAEPNAAVRAALVEGGSRLPHASLREEILFTLSDESTEVRAAAAIAPHRWTEEPAIGPEPSEIDSILVKLTAKRPMMDGSPAEIPGYDYFDSEEEDTEVIWRALFSLQRRVSHRARSAFHMHARARLPVESRLFAIKGLARLATEPRGQDEGSRKVLEGALGDSDWRVVCEALTGLGVYADSDSLVALRPLATHRSFHVRRALWEALGTLPDHLAPQLQPLFDKAAKDRSLSVRAAAAVAGTSLGMTGIEELGELCASSEPLLRAAAAEALAHAGPAEDAAQLLIDLLQDESPLVTGQATASLAELVFDEDDEGLAPESRATLRGVLVELLSAPDMGLRLAAVTALGSRTVAEDLPALAAAYTNSRGDVAPEVRFNLLRNVAEIEGDEATALLVEAQSDPDPYVGQVARSILSERAPDQVTEPRAPVAVTWLDELEDYPDRPRVEIHTTRGLMVFELLADEAPLHVHNFLNLAGEGFYEDLTFHRVVADFVVQGGCYRSDGNGSTTWREGWALPAEISPRHYRRGSLGMPRNENLDSGGSQIFVTHRPTPHLDGLYTIFGELHSGQTVLDAVEPGDRILAVRLRVEG